MSRRCQESKAHVTPARDQTVMKCWGCGATVAIESYEHRLYGTSYMVAEHDEGESTEKGV